MELTMPIQASELLTGLPRAKDLPSLDQNLIRSSSLIHPQKVTTLKPSTKEVLIQIRGVQPQRLITAQASESSSICHEARRAHPRR